MGERESRGRRWGGGGGGGGMETNKPALTDSQ